MAHAFAFGERQERDPFKKALIIVEDDPSNAEVLGMLLQLDDLYQVTCFRTGGEVLANVDLIKSLQPALFVLDYWLPHMTALDLSAQLRAVEGLEHVPTLVLSGSKLSNEEKACIGQLGLILIPKPYDVDDLLSTVEQLVA